MKDKKFSLLKITLLLCLLALLFAGERSISVRANAELQNSCENACACEGYTTSMLDAEYYALGRAPYCCDDNGDNISYPSLCAEQWDDWQYQYAGYVSDITPYYEQFLSEKQSECDECTESAPVLENPVPSDLVQPPQLPCEEEIDRDCDGIPDDTDLCPNLPGSHPGDMDCDDVPDDIDLCIGQFGTLQDCGCSDTGVAPGDLLFRNGGPAIASTYLPSLVGKATSEGEEYNFGHVGMYAGSFVADQDYPVLHNNGLKVYRQLPENEQPVLVTLSKGDLVLKDDIVPDAVLESDLGWGGVGISNLENLLADNAIFSGSDYYGVKVGTPRWRLTCDQRFNVVEIMADSARSRANGINDYNFVTENCANKISNAYQEGAGYAPWEEFREDFPLNIWDKRALTPNMVASFTTLNGIYSERRDTPQSGHIDEPKIAIEAYSPVHLHVYDSQGRHVGANDAGLEAGIPSSEVWYIDDGTKVINLFAPENETYDIYLQGYASGSYQLIIAGLNLPEPGSITKVVYPETPIQPDTVAAIQFSTRTMDPVSLTMYLDYDQDGTFEASVSPTITQGNFFTGEKTESITQTPLVTTDWILWGILPTVFCFGVSSLILIAGVFTKNKKISTLGIILIAVVICVTVVAAAFYAGSQLMSSEPANPIDNAPIFPPPQQDLPFPDGQPTVIVPADNPPTLAPVVPTIVQTEEPHSQEVYPEPTVYNFATCPSPCLSDLSNRQTTFPEKTERLYLRFNYDWIPPGADYTRIWKNGGQEWVRYQCKWDGPESGVFETDLREPAGFRSGEWTMEIYVNGKLISQNAFTVKGNYSYWEPAGTIYRCK